jgi:2-methylcitrate dehydratase PrpD
LTAVFDLMAKRRPEFAAIERIRIYVAPPVHEAHARFTDPKGTFEALLSFPFTVASALRDGNFWLDSVGPGKLADEHLKRAIKERVELVQDPALTRERSRIEVTLKGGEVLTAASDAAKGSPANPVTLADLRAKFERCVRGRLNAAESSELLDCLVRVDELADLSRLLALVRIARDRR